MTSTPPHSQRTWSSRSCVEQFGIYKDEDRLNGFNYKKNSRFIQTFIVAAILGVVTLLVCLMVNDISKSHASGIKREKEGVQSLLPTARPPRSTNQTAQDIHSTTPIPSPTTPHIKNEPDSNLILPEPMPNISIETTEILKPTQSNVDEEAEATEEHKERVEAGIRKESGETKENEELDSGDLNAGMNHQSSNVEEEEDIEEFDKEEEEEEEEEEEDSQLGEGNGDVSEALPFMFTMPNQGAENEHHRIIFPGKFDGKLYPAQRKKTTAYDPPHYYRTYPRRIYVSNRNSSHNHRKKYQNHEESSRKTLKNTPSKSEKSENSRRDVYLNPFGNDSPYPYEIPTHLRYRDIYSNRRSGQFNEYYRRYRPDAHMSDYVKSYKKSSHGTKMEPPARRRSSSETYRTPILIDYDNKNVVHADLGYGDDNVPCQTQVGIRRHYFDNEEDSRIDNERVPKRQNFDMRMDIDRPEYRHIPTQTEITSFGSRHHDFNPKFETDGFVPMVNYGTNDYAPNRDNFRLKNVRTSSPHQTDYERFDPESDRELLQEGPSKRIEDEAFEMYSKYWNPYLEDLNTEAMVSESRIMNRQPKRGRFTPKPFVPTGSEAAESSLTPKKRVPNKQDGEQSSTKKYPQLTNYHYPKDAKNIRDIIKYLTSIDDQKTKDGVRAENNMKRPLGTVMKLKGVYVDHGSDDENEENDDVDEQTNDDTRNHSKDFGIRNTNQHSSLNGHAYVTDPFFEYKPENMADINSLVSPDFRFPTPTNQALFKHTLNHLNEKKRMGSSDDSNKKYFPKPPAPPVDFLNPPHTSQSDQNLKQTPGTYTTAIYRPLGETYKTENDKYENNNNQGSYNYPQYENTPSKKVPVRKVKPKSKPLSVMLDIYPMHDPATTQATRYVPKKVRLNPTPTMSSSRPGHHFPRRPYRTNRQGMKNHNRNDEQGEGVKTQMVVHLNLHPKKKNHDSNHRSGEIRNKNARMDHHRDPSDRYYNEDYEGEIKFEDDYEENFEDIEDDEDMRGSDQELGESGYYKHYAPPEEDGDEDQRGRELTLVLNADLINKYDSGLFRRGKAVALTRTRNEDDEELSDSDENREIDEGNDFVSVDYARNSNGNNEINKRISHSEDRNYEDKENEGFDERNEFVREENENKEKEEGDFATNFENFSKSNESEYDIRNIEDVSVENLEDIENKSILFQNLYGQKKANFNSTGTTQKSDESAKNPVMIGPIREEKIKEENNVLENSTLLIRIIEHDKNSTDKPVHSKIYGPVTVDGNRNWLQNATQVLGFTVVGVPVIGGAKDQYGGDNDMKETIKKNPMFFILKTELENGSRSEMNNKTEASFMTQVEIIRNETDAKINKNNTEKIIETKSESKIEIFDKSPVSENEKGIDDKELKGESLLNGNKTVLEIQDKDLNNGREKKEESEKKYSATYSEKEINELNDLKPTTIDVS